MKKLFTFIILASLCATITAQEQEVRIFSHRGGKAEFDENTLSAFEASYSAGYRGFETDVRLSKDGKLVIMHDGSLKRTAGVDKRIEEMTSEEIQAVKTLKGNSILFLDELLRWLSAKGDMEYVEFEMKTDEKYYPREVLARYCDMLYEAVMSARPEGASYVFTSGDYRSLRYMTEKYPDADYLMITGHPCREDSIELCKSLGIKRIGATIGGTRRDGVIKAHEEGLIVSLWPGHSPADAVLGIYLGADYLCTDYPVQVKQFLETNATWLKLNF